MPFLFICSLVLLLLTPAWSLAANLEYSVSGLEGEPQQNVVAWLGAAPETHQERLNFLMSANDKVEHSLQALGYYRASIDIDVQKTEPVWQLVITVDPG